MPSDQVTNEQQVDDIAALQKKIARMDDRNHRLFCQNERLQQQVADQKKHLEDRANLLKEFDQKLIESLSAFNDCQDSVAKFVTQEREKSNSKISQLTAEVGELKRQLKAGEAGKENGAESQKISELTAKLHDANKKITQLALEVAEKDQMLTSLHRQNKNLLVQVKQLTAG